MKSRAESVAKRIDELDQWRADRASGRPATRADAELARQHADQSRQRAHQAHSSAAQMHDEAARMHDQVDTHDLACAEGHGDAMIHQAAAHKHRHAAERERTAAQQARERAIKD